jgi:hypothetical protein
MPFGKHCGCEKIRAAACIKLLLSITFNKSILLNIFHNIEQRHQSLYHYSLAKNNLPAYIFLLSFKLNNILPP